MEDLYLDFSGEFGLSQFGYEVVGIHNLIILIHTGVGRIANPMINYGYGVYFTYRCGPDS